MLFKLSLKNMKKSMKDYAIYFMTLILGVAIFYIFNAMDSQEAMMKVSESSRDLIKLMLDLLAGISVFISVILGFLIIYANNFLIKRRKKEFGIYMTLGMKKRQISKILVVETLLIGCISLAIGLVLGVFGSQLMSVFVAKMFETNMSQYEFVFSQTAMIKTIAYFGIMYVLVMMFNTISISKYKLIDLLTAIKKNEKIKMKNPVVCVIFFIISILLLMYAYQNVMDLEKIMNASNLYGLIAMGAIATFLFFWSLSGFMLKVIQSSKKLYCKDLNMFVLRQLNSKINTTVTSMTLICLMLFVTICVMASALSLNGSVKEDLQELNPVDLSIQKPMQVLKNQTPSKKEIEASNLSIIDSLKQMGFDVEANFDKNYVEVSSYITDEITLEQTLASSIDEVKANYRLLKTNEPEPLMKLSDYNKIARLFGQEELTLGEKEYLVVCDYENTKEYRERELKQNVALTIKGKSYLPKKQECIPGFIQISNQHINTGVLVFSDQALEGLEKGTNYLSVNYKANTEEEKQQIEQKIQALEDKVEDYQLEVSSKILMYEASRGLGAIVVFIGLYLGVIFLISSAAILALKELSESSDNKERYGILRKIGADEQMIHKALFTQIAIFFIMPLLLAMVHSVFGLQFANLILGTIGKQNMLASVPYTALFILVIYGGYFIATYLGSKNIIKEE